MKDENFVSINCPHCGKTLQIPKDAENLVCMYCAQPFDAKTLLQDNGPKDNFDALMAEAQRLVPDQIIACRMPLKEFSAKAYPDLFKEYTTVMAPMLSIFSSAAKLDEEQASEQFGSYLFQRYQQKFYADGIKKESDSRFFDVRYAIVALIIPAFMEYGRAGEALADSFLTKWNDKYPKSPLGKSDYKTINSGFHKKWCYITTAVCESLHRPDDCYELNMFRRFRDEWLCGAPNGERKIREYYMFAPMIVKNIERNPQRENIYKDIWKTYLLPCLKELELGKKADCAKRYETMVLNLEQQFLN